MKTPHSAGPLLRRRGPASPIPTVLDDSNDTVREVMWSWFSGALTTLRISKKKQEEIECEIPHLLVMLIFVTAIQSAPEV